MIFLISRSKLTTNCLELTLSIVFAIICAALLYFFSFSKNKQLKPWAVILFFVKIVVAGLFYYVYAYHYNQGTLSGDTFTYHHDSLVVFDLFKENSDLFWKVITAQDEGVPELQEFYETTHHWELPVEKKPINDSRNFIRFNALLCFIGRGYYFVHTIFYCFISSMAVILFYQGLLKFIKTSKKRIIFLIFFMPSVIFWTSGLLKESLLFLGFGFYLNAMLSIAKKENNWKIHAKLIIGITLLFFFKPYVLYCLIVPSLCFGICLYNTNFSKIKVYGSAVFLLFLTFLLWDKPVKVLSTKQQDFINISCGEIILEDETSYYYINDKLSKNINIQGDSVSITKTSSALKRIYFQKEKTPIQLKASNKKFKATMMNQQSGSYFEMTPINGSKWVMFKNLPFGINNVIFRPFPWDVNMDIFKVLAFIENIGLLFLILWAWRKRIRYQERTIKNIVSFLLFFTTLLFALIGQVTPVSGAIMRYKIPGVFVLTGVIVLLLYGYNKEHEEKKKLEEKLKSESDN